jgi:hypothetical protein
MTTEDDLAALVSELAGHLDNYAEDVARLSGNPGWRTPTIQEVLDRAADAMRS